VGCQRQLTVDDNTEVASGVRDGDARAEHQDVTAVNLVQQLTRTEPQQPRLRSSPRSDVTILVFSSRFDFDSIFYKEFDVNSISIFSSGNKLHKSN